MSDLIEREKAINALNECVDIKGFLYTQMNDALIEIPSIDIVRCQDCKHWVYNFNGCARNPCTEPWYATDFCNYGEKK